MSKKKTFKNPKSKPDGYTLLGVCTDLRNKLEESIKECDKRAKHADQMNADKNSMFWLGAKSAYENVVKAINREVCED